MDCRISTETLRFFTFCPMRGLSQRLLHRLLQPPLSPHSWGKKRKYLGTLQTPVASCCTVMACYALGIPPEPRHPPEAARHALLSSPRRRESRGKTRRAATGSAFQLRSIPQCRGHREMERGTPSDSLQRGFAPCTSLWNWQKECFLRSRKRDAHAEVQEETSCRGLGGVPQFSY